MSDSKPESILDKDLKVSKRKRIKISTFVGDFLEFEDQTIFANQLTYIANNPEKYGIIELTKYEDKANGAINFVLRIQEDLDLIDKNNNIQIKVQVFNKVTFDELDDLINEGIKPNSKIESLFEMRYMSPILGVCSLFIWATAENVNNARKTMEGLHAIRSVLKQRL